MKLIRNGVFETNSSSAHSLAYKNNVLRDYNYKPKDDLCFAVKELHLTKKPKEYEMYSYMPLYFDEYGWGFYGVLSEMDKAGYSIAGVCTTQKTLDYHKTVKGCSLSDILETTVHPKYYTDPTKANNLLFKSET